MSEAQRQWWKQKSNTASGTSTVPPGDLQEWWCDVKLPWNDIASDLQPIPDELREWFYGDYLRRLEQ